MSYDQVIFVWLSLGFVWGSMRHYVCIISTGGVQSFSPFSFILYTLLPSCEHFNSPITLDYTYYYTTEYTRYTYMDHFASPNGQAPLGNGGSPSPRHIIRLGRMTKMYVFPTF